MCFSSSRDISKQEFTYIVVGRVNLGVITRRSGCDRLSRAYPFQHFQIDRSHKSRGHAHQRIDKQFSHFRLQIPVRIQENRQCVFQNAFVGGEVSEELRTDVTTLTDFDVSSF